MSASEVAERIQETIVSSRQSVFVPLPSLRDVVTICRKAKEILEKENTLLENIKGKTVIVGDLHGNIDDLLHILYKNGSPNKNLKYLFLGDYVDRGDNSIETILYLLCLKVRYPDYVYLLRGNHEFVEMCSYYGFSDECVTRLGMSEGTSVFNEITNVFPYLPLAAVLQNEYFAIHGGIPANVETLDDIRNIKRFSITDYRSSDVVTDLVWGDPRRFRDRTILTRASDRGIGHLFSETKVKLFLQKNNLTSIFRAHEVCQEGFADVFIDPVTQIPICITVFSAANYCNMNNKGAVLVLCSDGTLSIYQYEAE